MDKWPKAEVSEKRCHSAGRSHMSIKLNSVTWPKPLDLAWPGARDLPSVLPFFSLFELVKSVAFTVIYREELQRLSEQGSSTSESEGHGLEKGLTGNC